MGVMIRTSKRTLLIQTLLALGFLSFLLAGCGPSRHAIVLAADDALPAFLNAATPRVRDAYRFAVANPSTLEQIPCYCGCGKMGHTSNLSCYISSATVGGAIVYDEHANGCGICVDITQDVMRLAQTGQSLWEIRTYVDAQYSPFGPSTDTPLPTKP
ncbi:MAG: PCYCGC motif-containing (lipo)protein [Caldilinea sp.]